MVSIDELIKNGIVLNTDKYYIWDATVKKMDSIIREYKNHRELDISVLVKVKDLNDLLFIGSSHSYNIYNENDLYSLEYKQEYLKDLVIEFFIDEYNVVVEIYLKSNNIFMVRFNDVLYQKEIV